MTKHENDQIVTIRLSRTEAGQICDGLYQRMLTWQATAQFLELGHTDISDFIEECSKPHEAKAIADFYQKIINKIKHQLKNQSPP